MAAIQGAQIGLRLTIALLLAAWPGAEMAHAGWSSRRIPAEQPQEPLPVVSSVCLHPSGETIATAGDDHFVRLWNVSDGRLIRQWAAHVDWVRSIAYSPDGRVLATAGNDGRIILWDALGGQQLRRLAEHDRPIAMLRYSHDGRLLATTGFEDKLRIYEVATGHVVFELDCPCRDMRAISFSPDDQSLAAGGRNGRIRIWSLTDGRILRQVQAHQQRIRAVEYSADGSHLVSTGEDRMVRVWSMHDDGVFDLPPLPGKVLALIFCDQHQIAAGMSDNTVRLWNLTTRQEVATLSAHAGSVCSLDYRKGILVSGSYDTTVRVWDVRDTVANRTGGDRPLRE